MEAVGETLVRVGMLAVIRDLQDFVRAHTWHGDTNEQKVIDADDLNAYLMAQLILAGGYDDGQS